MATIDALVLLEEGLQDYVDALKIVAKAASEAGLTDPDRFAAAVLARLAHADILSVRVREVRAEDLRQMLAEYEAEEGEITQQELAALDKEWVSPEDGLEWRK